MKVTLKNQVRKHQTGGQMSTTPPTGNEPDQNMEQEVAPQGEVEMQEEQDPLMIIGEMAAQALQNQDCQVAMQVCQAFLEILQQMQGGAPAEPQGEPVFKKGGILVRRIKK